MSDCERLSNRMPATARGAGAWTPNEERHLASCESCRREWDLVQRAYRLGAAAPFAIDSDAIAARALRQVRSARNQTPRRLVWAAAGFAAAASVVLLLRAGERRRAPQNVAASDTSATIVVVPQETLVTAARPTPEPAARPAPAPSAELTVPELDDLDVDELGTVLEALNQPFDANDLLKSPAWGDLEGSEFEPISVSNGGIG